MQMTGAEIHTDADGKHNNSLMFVGGKATHPSKTPIPIQDWFACALDVVFREQHRENNKKVTKNTGHCCTMIELELHMSRWSPHKTEVKSRESGHIKL